MKEISTRREIIELFSPAQAIKNQKKDILNLMETNPLFEKIEEHINSIQNHEMSERVRLHAYFKMIEKKYSQENIDYLKSNMGEWALSYVRSAEMMNLRDDWNNELKTTIIPGGHPTEIIVQKFFSYKIKDIIESSGDILDKPDECIELCSKILKLEKSESRKVLFQEANALLMNCHHQNDSRIIEEIKKNNLIIKNWYDENLKEIKNNKNTSNEEINKECIYKNKYIDEHGKTRYLLVGTEKFYIQNFYKRNLLINLHVYNQIPIDNISYIVEELENYNFIFDSNADLGVFYNNYSHKKNTNLHLMHPLVEIFRRNEELLCKDAGEKFVKHIKENNNIFEIEWFKQIFSNICRNDQLHSTRTSKLEEL
jgi:hypothetical protein